MSRSESIVVDRSWNVAHRRDLSVLVADLSDVQLVLEKATRPCPRARASSWPAA